MNKFFRLFKKVNGIKVLKQYFRAHILLFAVVETILIGFSKKSMEIVRCAADNKILNKLRKKYKKKIQAFVSEIEKENYEQKKSNIVWVCWFQGMEKAPDLVKKCFDSLKANLTNKEIIVITEENYKDYITFPEFIEEKIVDGIITKTHLSDLLRLELLINYGGTWIDATVFCSGANYPEYLFDSDLFMYQDLKPGFDGHSARISSWFMTACTNNKILLLTRALLYSYWKNKKYMIDYFLLHDFIELSIEAYEDIWEKVVPVSNSTPHILLLRLFEQYDERVWNATKESTCFHKLSYKFEEDLYGKKGTYFDLIIR